MTTVNFMDAVNAYASAGRMAGTQGDGAATGAGANFGDMLRQAASGTLNTIAQGEQASMQAATGKADLAKVTEAVSKIAAIAGPSSSV